MLKKLNIGCGKDIKKGCVNLDCIEYPGVDVVWDLDQYPWPLEDNTFSEIYAKHIVEHLNDFKKTMEEIKRISVNRARIFIVVPHFSFVGAYWDPTHKRFFSYFTFDYLKEGTYGLPIFKTKRKKLNFTGEKYTFLNYVFNPFINLSPVLYERFFCWILPCAEIIIELEVEK
ncbi:MAG: hypothetical protein PHI44_01960 [Candidatus Ratteibacteria bacterium]|nr:hypothetical protein [Candidatus Ratteibacteria bacterium]